VLSGSATIRFLASFGNVFFSLILGVIAMGFLLVYFPAEFNATLRTASVLREWIISHVWSERAEGILRLLLQDHQLLLMSIVLTVRFLLGFVVLVLGFLFRQVRVLATGGDVASAATRKGP
jgi:vacuolar-type H+-ATPase subunit I/STV1